MLKMFKKNKLWFVATLVLALSGATYFSYHIGQNASTLSLLKDGVVTCTGRLSKSYTARLLGGGEFLSSDFFLATEECLADVKKMISESDIKVIRENLKSVNDLSNHAYWLHKGLGNINSMEDNQNIDERFGKIEDLRLKIEADIIQVQEKISAAFLLQKIALFLFGGVILILLGWEIVDRRNKKIANDFFELTARDYAHNKEFGGKASRLISDALKYNELHDCNQLFESMEMERGENTFVKKGEVFNEEVFEVICEMEPDLNIELELEDEDNIYLGDDVLRDEFSSEEFCEDLRGLEIGKIDVSAIEVNPSESKNMSKNVTDFEVIFNRVVDLFQDKLTEKQVLIDVRGTESVKGDISVEDLTQIFHSLISDSIKRFNYKPTNKIIINFKKINEFVEFNYIDNAAPLMESSVDQLIVKEIIDDLKCDFLMEYSFGLGNRISVSMNAAIYDSSSKRVVSVRKGTKRELLKAMSL